MPSPTLIAEATRRSGAVWVEGSLLWHLWHDGAMYLVGGGPEQPLPVGPGDRARVVVRSKASQAGVVVEWEAAVTAISPGSPEWEAVVPLLAAERLNASPGLVDRWAAECAVLRLAPA